MKFLTCEQVVFELINFNLQIFLQNQILSLGIRPFTKPFDFVKIILKTTVSLKRNLLRGNVSELFLKMIDHKTELVEKVLRQKHDHVLYFLENIFFRLTINISLKLIKSSKLCYVTPN